MPKRPDLKSIMLLGSGPIVIGQAAEFDYSGTQAVKALREEGVRIILANSNPATIMTDPELADATYVEPLTPDVIEAILEKERPDALLPTLGGQTALNLALALAKRGTLERLGIELIGASVHAIEKAEDRELFKAAMEKIGVEVARSAYVKSLAEAREAAKTIGCPLLALWGGAGIANETGGPLAIWKQWAPQATGQPIDSGHFLTEENPDATAKALLDFFSAR